MGRRSVIHTCHLETCRLAGPFPCHCKSISPAMGTLAHTQGGITFIIGCLMVAFLPNEPFSAWWLTERQRCIAVMRVSQNRTGVQNKKFNASQAKEALLDIKTWLIFLVNIGLNIPNGGTATFSSIIINGLGFVGPSRATPLTDLSADV